MTETHFMAVNIRLAQCAGIYSPRTSSKAKRALLWTYNIAVVSFSLVFYTIAQLAALKHTAGNMNDLVQNINMSASYLQTLYKVLVWWRHREELMAIMRALQETRALFAKTADFDPDAIVRSNRRVNNRLTFTFMTIACFVISSACVLPLLDLYTGQAQSVADLKLAYPSWMPFDYRASSAAFCGAVAIQSLSLLTCGALTVGIDMLFYSLVRFTSTHFQLLQGAFVTIKERALASGADGRGLQERMYDELRTYIQHLQRILGICERLEAIYNVLILIQTLVSLVVFCTCLYIVSSIEFGGRIPGNEISYMMAVEIQFSLYCFAGNHLTTQAAGITDALYNSDWISVTSSNYRKNMILTMMRMNKPIVLTAGKFAVMSLAMIITIGRGSYSLLTFLKNTQ